MVSSPGCSRIVPAILDHACERRSLRKSVRQHFEYAMGCILLPDEGVPSSVSDTVGREFWPSEATDLLLLRDPSGTVIHIHGYRLRLSGSGQIGRLSTFLSNPVVKKK